MAGRWIVFGILLVGAFGALGAAAEPSAPPSQEPPYDRGIYERTLVGADGRPQAPARSLLEFEWLDNGFARRADGREVPVHRILIATGIPATPRTLAVDARGEIVSWTSHSAQDAELQLLNGLPLKVEDRDIMQVTWFGAPEAPDDRLEAEVLCEVIVAHLPTHGCGARWGEPVQTHLGHRSVTRQSDADEAGHAVWREATVPYPMRITVPDGERSFAVATLTRLTPGEPLVPIGSFVGETPPTLTWAPRTPWGMDDTDVVHPFPARQAYERAIGDLNEKNFAVHLAKPGAFIEGIEFEATAGLGESRWSWRFHLAAPDGRASTLVYRHRVPLDALDRALPSEAAATSGVLTDVVASCQCDWEGATPRSAPQTMPTVASLIEQWRAMATTFRAEETTGSWSWGHRVSCLDEACESPSTSYWLGRTTALVYAAEPGPNPHGLTSRQNFLVFDDAGTPKAFVRQAQHVRARTIPAAPAAQASEPLGLVMSANDPLGPSAWLVAGGVTVAALVVWGAWKAFTSGFSLYTLLRPGRALDHPARRMLHDAIAADPGVFREELLRRASLARGTFEHHLAVLERAGVVHAERGPRYICYFPTGSVDRRLMAAAPLLKAPRARAILDAVCQRPDNASGLASRVGVTRQTASFHLHRMTAAGLVSKQPLGAFALTELGTRMASSGAREPAAPSNKPPTDGPATPLGPSGAPRLA